MENIRLPFTVGDTVIFTPIMGDECYERMVPEDGSVGVVKHCVLNMPMLSLGVVSFLVTVEFHDMAAIINDEDLKFVPL